MHLRPRLCRTKPLERKLSLQQITPFTPKFEVKLPSCLGEAFEEEKARKAAALDRARRWDLRESVKLRSSRMWRLFSLLAFMV